MSYFHALRVKILSQRLETWILWLFFDGKYMAPSLLIIVP
jgi:hypothetical protein